ncbi:MAG TPA: class I SAM-dependent methyltransferase [Clostridia bacterium]|nr:class I SAM-dependent methyltransferase [Clostridia bacterium]
MKTIDKDVLAGYNAGIEKNRLREGLGLIEFERTKEILLALLPPAPAVIYDIGGGYGEYAYFLTALGYEVHLYDLSEKNIEMSLEFGKECGLALKTAEVADARSIDRPGASADAILLFGPLYHIVKYNERQLCLKECYRLLKPGGLLFAAAITRYATMLWAVTTYDQNALLDEGAFCEMLETEIKTGDHIKNPASRYRGMGRSYFHLPEELKGEIEAAGFCKADVRGAIGPCWLIPNLDEAWKDKEKRESIMKIVRLCDKEESIMGLSTHILGIARKN